MHCRICGPCNQKVIKLKKRKKKQRNADFFFFFFSLENPKISFLGGGLQDTDRYMEDREHEKPERNTFLFTEHRERVCQKQYHLFLLEKACLDDRFALRFSLGTLKRLLKIRFLGLLDALFLSAPIKKKLKKKFIRCLLSS